MDPAPLSPPSPSRRPRRALVAIVAVALGLGVVAAVALWPRGPRPAEYVVVAGDTLGRIAAQHGVTVQQLQAWNGLEGDVIQVGQVLLIHAELPAEAPRTTRSVHPAPAPAASARSLPPEQPCLPPPNPDDLGEGDEPTFLASQGLSQAQVEAAMSAFVPELFPCVPSGVEPDGVLSLSIDVACTGRVSGVRVLDDDALPAELVDCVQDSLRYAAFPAHDLPDGFGFHYPLTFRW